MSQAASQAQVIHWLQDVVVGLNLCPFAAKPMRENRIRFYVSSAQNEEALLIELVAEMALLDKIPAQEIETTLLIVPNLLQDFFDYTQFLNWAQSQLKREGWQGVYQLATFHPNYCFANAQPDDAENLTNRSPYPIIHIIREASLTIALNYFDDVEGIPERNQKRVATLSTTEKQKLFAYLFNK